MDPDFKRWLYENKHPLYAKAILNRSPQVCNLIFSDRFALSTNNRQKQEDLKVMGNICRYHDIKYDTDYHTQFTSWLKKKEVKWGVKSNRNNYYLASQITLEEILKNLSNVSTKYRIFGLFALTTGLRTEEAIVAFNNHSKICKEGVMELFWDRKTKKTNAVFCHPQLHDKIQGTVSKSGIKLHIKAAILGCELRYLRKLNYTMVATKIDPLLAEFMQGRRGNISQRHYFLPLMNNYRKKWEQIWSKTIQNIKIDNIV